MQQSVPAFPQVTASLLQPRSWLWGMLRGPGGTHGMGVDGWLDSGLQWWEIKWTDRIIGHQSWDVERVEGRTGGFSHAPGLGEWQMGRGVDRLTLGTREGQMDIWTHSGHQG